MSKWMLIHAKDNDIFEPTTYNTYEQAYEDMKKWVERIEIEGDYVSIHKDYASVQSDYNSWDWRIYEVRF